MKKKNLLLTMLCLLAVSFSNAQGGKTGNLNWVLTNGTLTISGTGAMPDYYITNTPWYANRESITTIVVEDEVTSIGNYAFYACENVTTVTLGNTIRSIGERAFDACKGLTYINLPNSLEYIGENAFYRTKLISIVIPNSITHIGIAAFYNISSLTSVTLSKNLITIDNEAFAYTSITSLTIPASVTSIGNEAFYACFDLEEVTVHATVPPTLGEDVFTNYRIPLYVPMGTENDYKTAPGWSLFNNVIGNNPSNMEDVYQSDIKIYPKLLTTGSTLYIENTKAGNVIRIYNVNGICIMQLPSQEKTTILNMNLTQGIYIIEVDNTKAKIMVK